MYRMFQKARFNAVLVASVLILVPVAAMAQDSATPPYAPATLVVKAADGTESQYEIGDISLYVSSSEGYDDVPASTDLSVQITTITPIDAALLQWAAQTTEEDKEMRDFSVSAVLTDAEGTAQNVTYEISKAHVTSFSMAHSTVSPPSFSLSVVADTVTLDGVVLN